MSGGNAVNSACNSASASDLMLNTVEAALSSDGALRFLEPVRLERAQRVLVTYTELADESVNALLERAGVGGRLVECQARCRPGRTSRRRVPRAQIYR